MKRKSQLSFNGLGNNAFKQEHGGALSLRRNKNFGMTTARLREFAGKFSIKIYSYSINSNHIHLALKAKTRVSFQNFLRAFASTVAKNVLERRAMVSEEPKKGFWDLMAYSKIVEWGRAFKALLAYVLQNELEAQGLIGYRPRLRRKATGPPLDASSSG